MSITAAKTKRVRVNKNRKKSWRKFSDVRDVEEHLEQQRFEERTGGPIHEKEDQSIFFIDKHSVSKQNIVKKKREFKPEQLKCYQNLIPDSKTKCPVIPPNKNQKKPMKTHDSRLSSKLHNSPSSVAQNKRGEEDDTIATYDLWKTKKRNDTGLTKEQLNYNLERIGKRKIKVPSVRYERTSALPAIEIPHEGASYNPPYESYRALLAKARKVKEKKLKEEKRLTAVVNSRFRKMSAAEIEKEWLSEMSQGIVDNGTSESEDESNANTPLSINPPVRAENRKELRKRKRQKRQKKLELEKKRKKLQVRREADVYQIKRFLSEIKETNRRLERRRQIRLAKKKAKEYAPRRLSRGKYQAPAIEVNRSSDLCGSLRTIKTEGYLITDRMKSFQRRNILEPKAHNVKRKKKRRIKKTTRRGYKLEDFE